MKRTLILLAMAMLTLSACAPAAAPTSTPAAALLPTGTPAPTATPTHTPSPTATPTVIPTVTPTPIPTLPPEQLGGLTGVPDPRYSNPELFDLNDPDAPIPQFVNAMRMAGIEIDPERIGQYLGFDVITGADGKRYVIAHTQNTEDELSDAIPLFVWDEGEWRSLTFKYSEPIAGVSIGTELRPIPEIERFVKENFNAIHMLYDAEWNNMEPAPGNIMTTNRQNWAFLQEHYTWGEKSGAYMLAGHMFFPASYPEWVKEMPKDDLEAAIIRRIQFLIQNFPRVNAWSVLNEYFPLSWGIRPDPIQQRLGYDEYMELVFRTAQEELDDSGLRDVLLLYSQDHNHLPTEPNYRITVESIDKLKKIGINNLGVGLQMHLFADNVPDEEKLIQTMQSFGVPVVITELDVNLKSIPAVNVERYRIQALIYETVVSACVKSGNCKAVMFFHVGDSYSWLETHDVPNMSSPDADPTPYDDRLRPKPAVYAMYRALFYSNTR